MYLNSLENLCFCCFCSIVLQGCCKDAQSPWVGLRWAGSQPFPAHGLNAAARHLVHSRDRWEEQNQRPCSDSLCLELHRHPCRLRVPHPQRSWQLVLGAHNWLWGRWQWRLSIRVLVWLFGSSSWTWTLLPLLPRDPEEPLPSTGHEP